MFALLMPFCCPFISFYGHFLKTGDEFLAAFFPRCIGFPVHPHIGLSAEGRIEPVIVQPRGHGRREAL
jgi:hypothetical protein